jgi:hexosaminidase
VYHNFNIPALSLSFLLTLTCAASPAKEASFALIPWPVRVEPQEGYFTIEPQTEIFVDPPFRSAGARLSASLQSTLGFALSVREGPAHKHLPGVIELRVGSLVSGIKKEGYQLSVAPRRILIQAYDVAGAFYGTRTLLQLLIPEGNGQVPCVEIEDWPRFSWRGLMLDCSRTFQSLAYLEKTIDRMAYFKMNTLHLHLTDDQGWRLEIMAFPELTGKGARFAAKFEEPESNQGFYTQEEMRALIRYGMARHVTIVPEIELPGHSLGALYCFPELSCTGGPFEIYPFFKGPGITRDIFCAGNEESFHFFEKVFAEVAALFPSEFIHVGGDEAPKDRWKACPKCQSRIRAENLKDEHELQSYFIRRAEAMLERLDRRLIGWDEILEGGLAPNASVMSWRGMRGGIQAARAGHDVVMSPTSHCYFDYTYGRISTRHAYGFEPIPSDLDPKARHHILGLQANFWSHIDRSPEKVDRQLFPRLLSIAERGWSSEGVREWAHFEKRARSHLPTLAAMGINYHPFDLAEEIGRWTPKDMSEEYKVLTFDITGWIKEPGRYIVLFQYTRGAHRLGIEWAALVKDGEEVHRDAHRGVTGAKDENNLYRLELGEVDPGATYELRASLRSEGGVDSTGEIRLVKI